MLKYVVYTALMSVSTVAYTPAPVYSYIEDAATTWNVDPAILDAICYTESNYNSHARNILDGGSPSYGLCQVKYKTARAMGYYGPVSGLYNPAVNSYYAARYLAYQYHRYGSYTKAVSAYSAGHYTQKNHQYVRKVLDSVQ